jgi:hypothetical protein
MQVGELRPLKVKAARIPGLEIELAENERVIKELQVRLAAAQANERAAGAGGSEANGIQSGSMATTARGPSAAAAAAAAPTESTSRMRALEAEVLGRPCIP